MITEKGSITAEFTPCVEAEKQYTKPLFIISAVCLALGAAGVLAYLVIDILSVFNILAEPSLWILFVVALPFAFGLIFFLGLRRAYRSVKANEGGLKFKYEFFADRFVCERLDGVNGRTATDYVQIIKRRETKDYLFASADMATIITVDKRELTEGEINALRSAFGLPVKEGERAILPPSQPDKREENKEKDK